MNQQPNIWIKERAAKQVANMKQNKAQPLSELLRSVALDWVLHMHFRNGQITVCQSSQIVLKIHKTQVFVPEAFIDQIVKLDSQPEWNDILENSTWFTIYMSNLTVKSQMGALQSK